MSPATARAEQSRGISHDRIYAAIARQFADLDLGSDAMLVDVGCGQGNLWPHLQPFFSRYQGVDLLRHPGFPADRPLVQHDLQQPGIPLPDGCAAAVVSCEVSPQLENPRVLLRECARLLRPGGFLVVTNPNLRSLRSLLTLMCIGQHNAFQDAAYPMMLTPILPVDLLRMAGENGLTPARLFYTGWGRALVRVPPVVDGAGNYPPWLAQRFPVACSDHVGVFAQKPLRPPAL